MTPKLSPIDTTAPGPAIAAAFLGAGLLILLASLCIPATTGCTPAERATAGTVLGGIGSAAPVACAVVAGLAGTVCPANLGNDVSDVAKLVQDILASLPPGMRAPGLSPQTPKSFVYAGAVVTLPAAQADAVWARLQARDGGA